MRTHELSRRAGSRVLRLLLGLVVALAGAQSAIAHDSGNILFYWTEGWGGTPGLFRTNTSDTFSDELTQPPDGYVDEFPSWSPTGLSVVFERRAGSRDLQNEVVHQDPTIMVVDRLGRRERPLAKGALPIWSGWSPNKIAFVTEGPEYPSRGKRYQCLNIVNHDGTGLRRLSCVEDDPSCTEFDTCFPEYTKLAWSPDGKYIVGHMKTLVARSGPGPAPWWFYQIYATEVATGRVFQVRIPNWEQDEPMTFSMGSGTTLYLGTVSYLSGQPTPSIYKLNFLTGGFTRITDGSMPLVSPDFRKIAYTLPSGGNRYARLYIANVDGSGATPVAGPSSGVTVFPLDWSRDSSHVLLQRTQYASSGPSYPMLRSLHLVTTTGVWRTARWGGGADTDAWQQR
jgi:Tol biopolymer transport system component